MVSRLNPYLSFNGNARRAMEFYASVFGGKLAFNTFAEFGAEDSPDADLIMHTGYLRRTRVTRSWLATSLTTWNTGPWPASR
jgi:hypothetical protein